MKLTDESKLFIGIILATFVIIGIGIAFFTKPAPILPRQELIPPGTNTLGSEKAKVFLVEFSDFQCSSCKEFYPIVNQLFEKYKDKLIVAYRHFPLEKHPFSQKEALAVEAAGAQGKFWQMHDLLFDSQERISDDLIIDLAKQLNLDLGKFQKDMQEEKLKEKILSDKAYGEKIGIDATPTFFLNGQKLTLYSFDDLRKQVEQATEKNPQ